MKPKDFKANYFKCRDFNIDLSKAPRIMGILNVTPDSFSDAGVYFDKGRALEHALQMQSEGADIVDIGAESTRPGARSIGAARQLKRIESIVKILGKKLKIPMSIDTGSSIVAKRCFDLGASIINDVYALKKDNKLGKMISRYKAGVVLMHMKKNPRTMQQNPKYDNVILEIINFLDKAKQKALEAGIPEESIILDPGIGFSKTTEHNLKIINNLSEFKALKSPILIGTSKKSFIGDVLHKQVNERGLGTAVSVVISVLNGANVVRVHDVKQTKEALQLTWQITKQGL
ncbi:MAG: dihydropteroate synthase [Candidatus Omnitrophica bacterium]|nr:dihydropteroate synthase [Candidatus Omnitrophota bacterium]